jgi:hypothetical protein
MGTLVEVVLEEFGEVEEKGEEGEEKGVGGGRENGEEEEKGEERGEEGMRGGVEGGEEKGAEGRGKE